MNSIATDTKQLVLEYLWAISGNPKTQNQLDLFVSDPRLVDHILQVEAAFPCYELIARQVIADGDLVALRGSFRGIHRGEFAGIAPTGNHIAFEMMIIYQIRDGRIAEHWMQFDFGGVADQLSRRRARSGSGRSRAMLQRTQYAGGSALEPNRIAC